MKKLKLYLPLFVVLFAVLCAALWYLSPEDEVSDEPVIKNIEICWYSYSSVESMKEASDIVIRGTVSESETELRGDLVYTRSKVEVTAVHSGDIQPGDIIEVVQTGGEYKNYLTNAPLGLPLMEEGCEYALFLYEKNSGRKYGDYYEITGYQGIAEITGGGYKALDDQNVAFVKQFRELFGDIG